MVSFLRQLIGWWLGPGMPWLSCWLTGAMMSGLATTGGWDCVKVNKMLGWEFDHRFFDQIDRFSKIDGIDTVMLNLV